MFKLFIFISNLLKLGIYDSAWIRFLWNEVDIPVVIRPVANSALALRRDEWFGTVEPILFIGTKNKMCRKTVVLHEVGHYLDLKNLGLQKFLRRATSPDREVQLQLEVTAWENAFRLSRWYGIAMRPRTIRYALKSYGLTERLEDQLTAYEMKLPLVKILGGNC